MKNLKLLSILFTFLLIINPLFSQDDDDVRIFKIAMTPSDIQFNPLLTYTTTEAQVYTAIHEGLVIYHPENLQPQPALASRWEMSDDGKTYSFYIRNDAKYSNGDAVLAQHFVDGWKYMLDNADSVPFAFLLDPIEGAIEYRTREISDFDQVGIKATADRVLEIELKEPADHFLSILCHQSLVAIHPTQLDIDWADSTLAIGAGPFELEEVNGDQIIMAKSTYYWDLDAIKIDQIDIIFSDDSLSVTERFNSGEIHWIYSGVDFSTLQVPNSVQINPQFGTSYYFYSQRKTPFDDERIRKAFTLLLPLDEIRSEDVYFFPTDTLVPGIPGYPEVEGISSSDVETGLRILEQAGYPLGRGLPEITIKILEGEESRRIANLMVEAWTEHLEIETSIEGYDFSEYQLELQKDDYVVGSVSWVGDYADPLTFLQLWTSDSTLNEAYNHNENYDDIISQSYFSRGKERYELLGEAEELLLQTASLIPISHSSALNVIDLETIDGWYPNPLDVHPFKNIFFQSRRAPTNVASLNLETQL